MLNPSLVEMNQLLDQELYCKLHINLINYTHVYEQQRNNILNKLSLFDRQKNNSIKNIELIRLFNRQSFYNVVIEYNEHQYDYFFSSKYKSSAFNI